jgi:hypothetical protein
MRTLRRTAAIVSVGLVMAACGGNARLSHPAYQQRLTANGTNAGTTVTKLFWNTALLAPKSVKDAAKVVRQGASAIDGARAQVDALHAPPDAVGDNAQLAKGFHELAAELRQFADAADAGT